MSWTTSALVLCAIASTAAALPGPSGPSINGETELLVRGYTLTGELLLYPTSEQVLPAGWSLEHEAHPTSRSLRVPLTGQGELTTSGADLFTLFTQPMATGDGQLQLRGPGVPAVGLGDLSLAFFEGDWSLLSSSETFSGRPAFEMLPGSRTLAVQPGGEVSLTGELVLSSALADELGLGLPGVAVVAHLTLIGSPHFGDGRRVEAGAGSSAGSTMAMGSIGPDVIVSGVGSTLSFNGEVGGISAYSVTTVSCNIGDANAIWIDCTNGGPNCNQHPVIGTQLYRRRPGGNGYATFEQLGMSWLKHGFCAADAPSCPGGTYQNASGCDWLGLFATDTYSASLNGSQSNLGPRSEIQPFTGVYPYPYNLGWNTTGNSIYKRCQVASSELDPAQNPGSEYWFEVVYITTDESELVRDNNYSARKALVGTPNGGGWNMSFTGGTQVQMSALEAWAQADPDVTVTSVDVPGDGRFLLATAVTDLGNGEYHYEYVLQNQNSDRGGQALSVPLGLGASATNVGFSDVDYHSGESYASTDWTSNVVPDQEVTWETETEAQNANANALRWSTSYSYRLDSTGAPGAGVVTLTLFKNGTPTTVDIPAEVPTSACAAFTYCTTSTTTHGCSPQISGSGIASATASSGFVVSCSGLEPNKSGTFFYGHTQIAVAWNVGNTSTRCVTGGVKRTPVQSTGGSSGCDGSFSIDWNAYRATKTNGPLGAWAAGQTFYGQYWFRDPPTPGNSNLSNAVGFTLCP